MNKVLITGAAGFIGYHLAKRLCVDGFVVDGLDNLNTYYEPSLKETRLNNLKNYDAFRFFQLDIADKKSLDHLFHQNKYDFVVNLAAQAGVRHSIENPYVYLESNIHGFLNILEACRYHPVRHLVYASSSSVYGANKKMPFSVHDNVDHPLALYAASKKSNELMAHAYSNLYNIPTTGLRFFSAYGPYGRPDMALFIFTKAILANEPINVFNHGKMKRDFTYVDDLVECIVRLMPKPAGADKNWNGLKPDPSISFAPYKLFNVGNSSTIELIRYIEIIEEKLGRKAIKNFLPMQEGDVPDALADVKDLENEINYKPSTPIEVGVGKFIDWYLEYYKVKLK
jgi:UDP-glucuronate 4-epimerase